MGSYINDEELRATAREIAADCQRCTVKTLQPVTGSAVRYELCLDHHRELHRRYVHANRSDNPLARIGPGTVRRFFKSAPDPEDVDREQLEQAIGTVQIHPKDVGADYTVIEAEQMVTEAGRTMAAAIAADPSRGTEDVRDACMQIVRNAADRTSNQPYWCARETLACILAHDSAVALDVASLLRDEDEKVQRKAAGILELMAIRNPEAVLRAGDGAPVVDLLVKAMSDGNHMTVRQAIKAFAELVRNHPDAGLPGVGALGASLTDSRFAGVAALALGRIGFEHPEAIRQFTSDIESIRTDETQDGIDRSRATLAVAYLGETVESVQPVAVDDVRTLADPSEHSEGETRKAVHALGRLGDTTDQARLEWIRDACFDADLESEARTALARVQDSSQEESSSD